MLWTKIVTWLIIDFDQSW